jgi:hypothetical protein
VAMSLQTRVRVLESGSGGANCPECGWDGITPLEPVIDHSYGGVPKENEYCGTCGRPVHITLTWGAGGERFDPRKASRGPRGHLRRGADRAPDGGKVPALRQGYRPRPDPGDHGWRAVLACSALDGARSPVC